MPALVHSREFVHSLVSYRVPWKLADTATVRCSFMYVYVIQSLLSSAVRDSSPRNQRACLQYVHTSGGAQDGLLTDMAAQ